MANQKVTDSYNGHQIRFHLNICNGVVPGGARGATQILTDQLTLSQPGGQIMPT